MRVYDRTTEPLDDRVEALAEKVRSRAVGLLVMPGLMGGGILDQPSMQGLLPVAKARKIEGEPIPGVSMEESPFYVTAPGTEHPATRIVPFKDWSEKIWAGHLVHDDAPEVYRRAVEDFLASV